VLTRWRLLVQRDADDMQFARMKAALARAWLMVAPPLAYSRSMQAILAVTVPLFDQATLDKIAA
jgi:hypothetical protein